MFKLSYFLLLLFFFSQANTFAQKKKGNEIKEKISRYFAYQQKYSYSDKVLVVKGKPTEIAFSSYEQIVPNFIWLKTNEYYILIDTNAKILVGEDQKLSYKLKTDYSQNVLLNKNLWFMNDKGWRLFSVDGKILVPDPYKNVGYLGKNRFVITDYYGNKKICNNTGEIQEVSFSNFEIVSHNLPLIAIQSSRKWHVYNYESFETGRIEFDSIISAGHDYILINAHWQLADIKSTNFTYRQIPEGKLVVSFSSEYFFVESNNRYNAYSPYDSIFNPIGEPYDNVKNSTDGDFSYAKRDGDWYLLNDTLCINMYYSDKQISFLTGQINSKMYIEAYDRSMILHSLNKLHGKGLIPFPVETFEIELLQNTTYPPYITKITTNSEGQENNPVGIYDYLHNRFILNPVFNEIDVLPSGLILFSYDNTIGDVMNYGVADTSGKIIIPCNYLEITDHWLAYGMGRIFVCKINTGIYDIYDCLGAKVNNTPLLFNSDLSKDGFLAERIKTKYYIQNNCLNTKQKCVGYEFEKTGSNYTVNKITEANELIKNTKLFENHRELINVQLYK